MSFFAEATPFSSAIEFLATLLGYIFVLNILALNKVSFIRVSLTRELFNFEKSFKIGTLWPDFESDYP